MAKAMTADQLENLLTSVLSTTIPEIMSKILEKFDTCFDKLLDKFETKLDKFYGDLFDVNVRLDKLEHSLADIKSCINSSATGHSATSRESETARAEQKTDPTLQVLLAIETEKAERIKRQRNIIITGLPEVPGTADDVLFSKFCEDNLTIKPRPMHCRRVGRVTGDQPKKLKITLDSDSAVEDLILSSHILRAPTSTQRNVFINRDLTPMESLAAFELRQSRKSSATQVNGLVASS
jgi:hypothetical protein